jgi:hypothetical protein
MLLRVYIIFSYVVEIIMEAIRQDLKPKEILEFPNVDFTDEEDRPGGIVTLHNPSDVVHHDAISNNVFSYMVLCPTKATSDDQFSEKLLQDAIPQFSNLPPDLKKLSSDKDQDEAIWNAELGSPDAFAGIFKRVGEDMRSTEYFVVAHAGAPIASAQLREYVAQHPNLTYEELLSSPEYNHCHYIAERNAQRLAYNVARAFKVPIKWDHDHFAAKEIPDSALPKRADPALSQTMSTIQRVKGGMIGVFNKVRPIEQCQKVNLVYAGPYDGIALFNMKSKSTHIGLPANVGRKATASRKKRTMDWNLKRSRGIIWENKDMKNPIHADLDPEAFRTIDDSFLSSMREMGWSESGTNTRHYLVPVAVKIFNPEIRRIK